MVIWDHYFDKYAYMPMKVIPHIAQLGRILVFMITRVKEELRQLEKPIIIVNKPMNWNSQMVISIKTFSDI